MICTVRLPKFFLFVAVSHFSLLDASAQSPSRVVSGDFVCETEEWLDDIKHITLEHFDIPVTTEVVNLTQNEQVFYKLDLSETLKSQRANSAIRIVFEVAPQSDRNNVDRIPLTLNNNCQDSRVKSGLAGEVILDRDEGYSDSFQLNVASVQSIAVVVKVTAQILSNTLIAVPPQTMAYSQPAAIAPAFTAAGGVCYPANAPWCRRAGRRGLVRYRR